MSKPYDDSVSGYYAKKVLDNNNTCVKECIDDQLCFYAYYYNSNTGNNVCYFYNETAIVIESIEGNLYNCGNLNQETLKLQLLDSIIAL